MNKKTKTSLLILVPTLIISVILFEKGRNTSTAQLEVKQTTNTVSTKPAQKLDHSLWYKNALQNADEKLKTELGNTSLILDADEKKYDKYKDIYKAAYTQQNILLAAMAAKKMAESKKTDTSYSQAGNVFIENSLRPSTSEDERLYSLGSAREMFDKSLAMNPKSIEANNGMALAIIQLGQDPPMVGIGYLKKSLALDSNNFATNYLYGQMLMMSSQYEKAIKVYNKLVNLQPSNAGLFFTLSDLYGKMGNDEKAKEYLNKAKNLNK